MSERTILGVLLLAVALLSLGAEPNPRLTADKQALAALQSYVGQWKGVGQPKRGSSQGAWTEQATWAWQFADGRASLVAEITSARFYSQLELRAGDKAGQFVLLATPVERSEPQRFVGAVEDGGQLILKATEPAEGSPARISLRLVAGGDRLLVLYERQASGDQYVRLAEVGSTRKGSSFAKGTGYPECIVTGGYGSMTVEHDGQTYYVCCTGCRDLFLEDPAAMVAEYQQRKAAEEGKAAEKPAATPK